MPPIPLVEASVYRQLAIHGSMALHCCFFFRPTASAIATNDTSSVTAGIKVTTFVVMIIATIAFFRRQQQLHAFGRSIALDQVLKVMALTAISLILVFVGIFLLTASHDGQFLDISFEVASAFGTVGLSRGYTGELNDFGRAVIVAIMFLGRVGPLTLGFFLATRVVPRVRYPEGRVYLG